MFIFSGFLQTAFVVDEVSGIVKDVCFHSFLFTYLSIMTLAEGFGNNSLIVFLKSIEGVIGGNIYQQHRVNMWTSNVVEQCLSQLSKLGKPFKYIGKYLSMSYFAHC